MKYSISMTGKYDYKLELTFTNPSNTISKKAKIHLNGKNTLGNYDGVVGVGIGSTLCRQSSMKQDYRHNTKYQIYDAGNINGENPDKIRFFGDEYLFYPKA